MIEPNNEPNQDKTVRNFETIDFTGASKPQFENLLFGLECYSRISSIWETTLGPIEATVVASFSREFFRDKEGREGAVVFFIESPNSSDEAPTGLDNLAAEQAIQEAIKTELNKLCFEGLSGENPTTTFTSNTLEYIEPRRVRIYEIKEQYRGSAWPCWQIDNILESIESDKQDPPELVQSSTARVERVRNGAKLADSGFNVRSDGKKVTIELGDQDLVKRVRLCLNSLCEVDVRNLLINKTKLHIKIACPIGHAAVDIGGQPPKITSDLYELFLSPQSWQNLGEL